jgi:hypothetical protein
MIFTSAFLFFLLLHFYLFLESGQMAVAFKATRGKCYKSQNTTPVAFANEMNFCLKLPHYLDNLCSYFYQNKNPVAYAIISMTTTAVATLEERLNLTSTGGSKGSKCCG